MAKNREGREGTGGVATLEGAAPAPDSPPAPTNGSGPPRMPRIGEWVHYFRLRDHKTQTCAPIPAQVIYHSIKGNHACHLNVHDLGEVIATLDVAYTATPRMGHWTFPPQE